MTTYNLTDEQKYLLRTLVQAQKDGKLEGPIIPVGLKGGYRILNIDEHFGPSLLGDLDELCDQRLLRLRYNDSGKPRYFIRKMGQDAVANDFVLPEQSIPDPISIGWKQKLVRLGAIGLILAALAFIADVTGILSFFGINPFPTSTPVATIEVEGSVHIEGDVSGSTIVQSEGDVNIVPPVTQPDEVVRTQQVQRCMDRHNLASPHDMIVASGTYTDGITGSRRFLFCDWPPPSYAEPDGFTEIRVDSSLTTEIEGADGTHSLIAPSVDRIQSNCQKIRLSYFFVRQADYEAYPPQIVNAGQVVHIRNLVFGEDIETDSLGIPLESAMLLNFYPERDDLVVLSLIEEHLEEVECVE